MKHFPHKHSKRQPPPPSASTKQHDALSSSPNTITLKPNTTPTTTVRSSHNIRHQRAVSDGECSPQPKKSQSPLLNPPILSVLGEEDEDNAAALSVLEPPPSPGTPPRKLWERQYGSFLRNRIKSNSSLAGSQEHLYRPATPSDSTASDNSKQDESIRGGKFFSSVFRSSSDPTKSHSTSRRKAGSVDELDGTMRRGSEKAYSPGNSRYAKSSLPLSKSNETIMPSPKSNSNYSRQNDSSPSSFPIAVEDYSSKILLSPTALRIQDNQDRLPVPPLFIPPRAAFLQQMQQQQQLQQITTSTTGVSTVTASVAKTKSSAMKKAFTGFHNSSTDANSAYLGDDPSQMGRNLFFAQKNEQLLEASTSHHRSASSSRMTNSKSQDQIMTEVEWQTALAVPPPVPQYRSTSCATGSYNSPLDTVPESVNVDKNMRSLKQISGVEAWQTGRRYLIAPAALAACPLAAIKVLLGNSVEQVQTAEQAATAIFAAESHPSSLPPPFGMIHLGECLLTYVMAVGPSKTRTVKKWSSAQLVLRQNYLLEYDVSADVQHSVPRGYAHLQYATTHLHEHFQDALELHFFGSPCAMSDARILMIRIVGRPPQTQPHQQHLVGNNGGERLAAASAMDDSVHLRPEIREHWSTCLNRAASLNRVSDLYDYDETAFLGQGQYAEVRAARRRQHPACAAVDDNEGPTNAASRIGAPPPPPSPRYDCAIKIFDKDKFWRLVVKGMERADTIVREASVQSTLLARCGQNPSFLRILGFFETADKVVLELELLDGTDLFKYISSKNVLKEAEAAMILRDILHCLDAMSKIGLAHRDIKPANILMCGEFQPTTEDGSSSGAIRPPTTAQPRVKVGDFGMAAFVGVDGQVRGRCGTPGYVAPEIFTAGIYGGYGNKVDVFSAGVTLYVMLCGYEPFYGETDDELKEANKTASVDFPCEDWASVSTDAQNLVKQMMQVDPAKRLDARQALQNPWFAKNLPKSDEWERSVSVSSHNQRDDACVVS